MTASPAAQRLRRIADSLAEGRLPNSDDCREHAAALDAAMGGVPLLQALGLRGRWWAALASELLTQAILGACLDIPGFGEERADNAVAKELRRRLSEYEADKFREDQRLGHAPPDRVSLFSVLSLNGNSVPGLSTIRGALREHFLNSPDRTADTDHHYTDEPPHEPSAPSYVASGFIAPISKTRLMGGR